ncbi:MAG: pyruvate dehydrogenase complex dihydrolipoamide acetyltransferase [Robiginitomaculum sp.]|nr:pyruvate dehydrogenase complex dihydrolipoamide acetyltransferase [Robiginitomaculum sp.]
MAIEILMPALSPTMEEGVLAKWHVKTGDAVQSGDVLFEIETDKASMEVESIDEGVMGEILVTGGTEDVKVNAVVGILLQDGEDASAVETKASPKPAAKPDTVETETPAAITKVETAPVKQKKVAEPVSSSDRIKISPLAKRLSEQEGLNLANITGTGTGGRIVKRDVEQAIASGAATAPDTAQTSADGFDLIPLDGMRKTIAKRMTESFRDVPHFPLNVDCEIDNLLSLRKQINEQVADDGIKLSVNDFIVRAAALALVKVPEANSSYTPEGLKHWHSVDISIAVAIDGGLITPVIRDASNLGLAAISSATKDLATRARDRKLLPEEYQGGTFTISNMGMMGIKSFASIINQPQACIMSVGAGEKRAVVKDGELAVATMMTVTLTCDHRVVDGAIGARLLAEFKARIENPGLMLL